MSTHCNPMNPIPQVAVDMASGLPPERARRFLVAQLGARMHYAVPIIFEHAGILERFYTDICVNNGPLGRLVRLIPEKHAPAPVRRFAGRLVPGVPRHKIHTFDAFGCTYFHRHTRVKTPSERTALHLWGGRTFGRMVARTDFGEATGVYTYNTASLEILRQAKSNGLMTVMEQTIAPRRIEEQILAGERERWQGWEVVESDDAAIEMMDRERDEWETADVIICPSEFVREGVRESGGPAEKCVVVPYGVRLPAPPQSRDERRARLRVLFVGSIGLRKGVQYLAAAAKLLGQERFEFRIVGPIGLSDYGMKQLARSTEIVEPVQRAGVAAEYQKADIFVCPSLCEGSATVCYEALANGLPVVATVSSGSIVRDGEDGIIIPAGDVDALVAALERLSADHDFRRQVSVSARRRAEAYGDLASYGERLARAVSPGARDSVG